MNMKTKINEVSADLNSMSDTELSAVFAVEVAGDTPEKLAFASRDEGKSGALFEDSRYSYDRFTHLNHVEEFCEKYPGYKIYFRYVSHGNFANSMDAVLPYLEKRAFNIEHFLSPPSSYVIFIYQKGDRETLICEDTSLPRAACIALILAARAEKGGAR